MSGNTIRAVTAWVNAAVYVPYSTAWVHICAGYDNGSDVIPVISLARGYTSAFSGPAWYGQLKLGRDEDVIIFFRTINALPIRITAYT